MRDLEPRSDADRETGRSGASEATLGRVAESFTRALDAGDLAMVSRLLAPDVECRDGATVARGAEDVVALYRVALRWLEQGFDDVRHHGVVERCATAEIRIDVTTTLMRVPGRWHRLRHTRDLEVRDGAIRSVVHGCAAPAASAFRAFVAACSVAPPPPGFGVEPPPRADSP